LFNRTSATNCACLYNLSLNNSTPPNDWAFGFTVTTDHIWDGFVILALLEDCQRRSATLEVPHTGAQKDRRQMVWVVVIDGVTVGHPCCARHNCKIPLANNRH
ncbi:hypothetical protein L208DRAFT_1338990, partial [Tricholoma matsutake]